MIGSNGQNRLSSVVRLSSGKNSRKESSSPGAGRRVWEAVVGTSDLSVNKPVPQELAAAVPG